MIMKCQLCVSLTIGVQKAKAGVVRISVANSKGRNHAKCCAGWLDEMKTPKFTHHGIHQK